MRISRVSANQKGFTMPELLVVIAIFAVLGGVSLLLLRNHPTDVEQRNAERQTSVAYIVQALTNYHKKYQQLPSEITTTNKYIDNTEEGADICSALVPEFATDLPYDPTGGGFTIADTCNAADQEYLTGFAIRRNHDATTITVSAPGAEAGKRISITKKLK